MLNTCPRFPGSSTGLRVHPEADILLFVVGGELHVSCPDGSVDAGGGDTVVVKAGVRHALTTSPDSVVVPLICLVDDDRPVGGVSGMPVSRLMTVAPVSLGRWTGPPLLRLSPVAVGTTHGWFCCGCTVGPQR